MNRAFLLRRRLLTFADRAASRHRLNRNRQRARNFWPIPPVLVIITIQQALRCAFSNLWDRGLGSPFPHFPVGSQTPYGSAVDRRELGDRKRSSSRTAPSTISQCPSVNSRTPAALHSSYMFAHHMLSSTQ